jgi:peptidoglycan/LPS O-acetylase OafA/YrhL
MRLEPTPWPRLADAWWVYVLGGAALVLYPVGLITRLRCELGGCTGSALHLFDPDSVGGLPRLFITCLFLGVCALGWVGRRRSAGRVRTWWTGIAAIGAALALAKLVSAHSLAKNSEPGATLVVGILLTGLVLAALRLGGRRWGVGAARPIVVALGAYAAAALGLDAVTTAIEAAQAHAGALSAAASTFVEELGEALAALFVVVSVRWNLPKPGPNRVVGTAVRRPGSSRR